MPRRTILVLSGNGPPVFDGVGHYTSRLLASLAISRPDWRLLWLRRKQRWFSAVLATQGNVRVIQPWHTWSKVGIFLAEQAVKYYGPDIVHVQEELYSFHESPVTPSIMRTAPHRRIVTLHELHPGLQTSRHTVDTVSLADLVIANDAYTATKCERATGRRADHVLWSPANVLPDLTVPAVARRPGLVVTFGMLSAVKGMEQLFRALKLARTRMPSLRWRIIGPFDPQHNAHDQRLAATISADWVEFTGGRHDLDDPILKRWIAEGSVMALPFVDGATARRGSLQTAWAFGLPVVTTPPPVGGDAMVQDSVNCVTVQLSDELGWASAVVDVLSASEVAHRLTEGSKAAGDQMSWSQLADAHLKTYEKLLG